MNDRATKYLGEKYKFPVKLKSCWEIGEEVLISFEYKENGFDCTKTIKIDKTKINNN